MSRWADRAYRIRWLILVIGLLCLGVWTWLVVLSPGVVGFAGLLGTPANWMAYALERLLHIPELKEMWVWLVNGLFFAGLLLVAQWWLLRPVLGRRVRLTETGRPMWRSIIAAAFLSMLLTVAAIAVLLELPRWWPVMFEQHWSLWAAWGAMALIWAGWAGVFYVYWRQGDRYTHVGRMIRGLLAGSVVEMLVATGVYAWNPHQQQDCYCARGSYTGLIFGGTVLVWVFGPGIVLLFLREHYRRQKFHLCLKCGYDLRGNPAATSCPECGAALTPNRGR